MLRHIVFFKLKEGVGESVRQEAIGRLTSMGQNDPDVHSWTIKLSLDSRKGDIIIENGLLTDQTALERFRLSDKHRKVGEFMREIADWWVGDYEE